MQFPKYIRVSSAYYSYNLLELLAEVGRHFGLFLGVSIIQISGLMKILMTKLEHYVKNRTENFYNLKQSNPINPDQYFLCNSTGMKNNIQRQIVTYVQNKKICRLHRWSSLFSDVHFRRNTRVCLQKKKNEENGSIFQIFFRAFKIFHLSFKLKPDRKKVGCV